MTAHEFAEAIDALFPTQGAAARRLGAPGQSRVSEWATGARPVPRAVAAHVRTLLELEELRARLTDQEVDDG